MKYRKREIKNKTIMQKLTLSYFLLVFALLIVMSVFIIPTQLQEFNTSLENHISWTGYLLSCNTELIRDMKNGIISDSTQNTLQNIINSSKQIDYIVIANTDSVRLYHPDADEIGKPFIGGDEKDILSNSTPYVTTSQGREDIQKRSFHQITDSDGTVLGFILVSASISTVRTQQLHLIHKFLICFCCLLILGILFAWFTSNNIRKSLLGHEPDTFAKMFLQREEILENLTEGIMAVDTLENTIYTNPPAQTIFGDKNIGTDIYLSNLIKECIRTQKSSIGIPYEIDEHSLLLNFMPLVHHDKLMYILVIIRDRTETIQLAEQLTGSNHIVEALRATTHEFLNKLHIISGLLQIGELEEAVQYIDGLSDETHNSYQTTIRQIQNKTIAALILGKQSHAKELNIQFSIQKDSYLESHNPFLSTKELVTVVGNLVENAFHAVEESDDLRQVELYINQTSEGIMIVVDDTGCGISKENIQKIYDGHFTTRGDGHGIGLTLIQEIVRKHNGYLSIESEPAVGSSFTISIQKTQINKITENRGETHD